MPGFMYRGAQVSIPFTADITTDLRPSGKNAGAVQTVLDGTDPWKLGEDPVETCETQYQLRLTVIENNGRTPIWAVHTGHKAKQPQLSPFLSVAQVPETRLCTIELVNPPNAPRLVRAYSGDYTPPLPWQASAADADGGVRYCREFWRTHSYVFNNRLIKHDSRTRFAPAWYHN